MSDKIFFIDSGDRWIIPINGKTVTRLLIDFAFTIQLWEQNFDVKIRIAHRFKFLAAGREIDINPEELKELSTALELFNKSVESAIAYKNGKLVISFVDGSGLTVEADDKYEAWEISGTNQLRMVCTPGGNLSVWQLTKNLK